MNVLDDMMLMYRVAKSYYVDQLSQSEIAKMVGISRPQISRLIKRALEVGIVKIDVSMPETLNVRDMEKELASCLGVRASVIIPTGKAGENDNFFAVAAKHVSDRLKYCVNIGIGWGRTMYKISKQLTDQTGESKEFFYPLLGSSGDENPYLQISSITDRFAEHYHARARYLNLPVFRKDDQFSVEEKQRLKAFRNKWRHLDGAVVGIGEFNTDNQIYIDEISYDPFLQKHKDEVVGDILAHLLLEKGGELVIPGYYHVACTLDDLLHIPEVIGVARGEAKVDAIYIVAKNGYIKTLITDDTTAKEIIKKYH